MEEHDAPVSAVAICALGLRVDYVDPDARIRIRTGSFFYLFIIISHVWHYPERVRCMLREAET